MGSFVGGKPFGWFACTTRPGCGCRGNGLRHILVYPLRNVHLGASATGKVAVNVVKPVSPSLQPLLFGFHEPFAEPAPVARIKILAFQTLLELGVCGRPGDGVLLGKMRPELFATVAGFAAFFIQCRFFVAFPQFVLVVLAVFMSLPVVFAAKFLFAKWKCTSVGLLVSLLMLPGAL